MADNPFFSIIVPVYGVEKYLRECVDSILNQTFSDFELILVDDGSKDSCPQICDEYAKKDNRITVLHKENGGVVSARQAGAKIVRGKYCLSVDGDDYIDKNTLLVNYDTIRKFNPDIVCYGFFRKIDKKNIQHFQKSKPGFYKKNSIIEEIYPILIQSSRATHFDYHLGYKSIKSNIYKEMQMRVDSNIKIEEDCVCSVLCMLQAETIYVLNKSLYYYRANTESVTQDGKGFEFNVADLVFKFFRTHIDVERFDFASQIDRKYVHDVLSIVLSYYFKCENFFEANKIIKPFLANNHVKEKLKVIKFTSFKAISMQIFLKYRIMLPVWIYAKLKKHF